MFVLKRALMHLSITTINPAFLAVSDAFLSTIPSCIQTTSGFPEDALSLMACSTMGGTSFDCLKNIHYLYVFLNFRRDVEKAFVAFFAKNFIREWVHRYYVET